MNRRSDSQHGFTLTELLVGITLTGIIGLIVGAAVITGLRQQTKVGDRNNALSKARTALQRIDRDLRSANPLTCAAADQVVVKEVGATTTWLTYSVVPQTGDRSEIVVDTFGSPPACGSDVASSRSVLLTDLVDTSTDPVFTFSPGTVTVNVRVQPTTLSQPVVLSDNGVALRNPA